MVPADGAHRARTHAIFLGRRNGRFAQLGMRRQPQVIVRRQVDDVLAVNRTLRRLLILKHTQIEVRAFLLEFVHLVGKVGELWAGRGRWHF